MGTRLRPLREKCSTVAGVNITSMRAFIVHVRLCTRRTRTRCTARCLVALHAPRAAAAEAEAEAEAEAVD